LAKLWMRCQKSFFWVGLIRHKWPRCATGIHAIGLAQ
jgi:hypothetical protein